MALHIRVDGTMSRVATQSGNGSMFTLDELRSYVGGYIEMVYRGPGIPRDCVMIVNEEGWVCDPPLQLNVKASLIAGQPIAGDVLLCKLWQEIE